MILTIKYADFSSANIGTLNTYVISKMIGEGATFDIPNFVDKNSAVEWVITLTEDYVFGTYTIIMGSETITPTVNGNTMTISIPSVTGHIRIVIPTYIDAGEVETPDTPVEPDTPVMNTITWEQGPMTTPEGKNNDSASASIIAARIRTKNFLKIDGSITISVTGNAEFCPVYVRADGTTESPNAYQTTERVVNESDYAYVRIMARNKTSASSAIGLDFGQYVVVTGSWYEVPYSSVIMDTAIGNKGEAPIIADNMVWAAEAIDSNNGIISKSNMPTRLSSTRILLTSTPITISVTGDAEMCPFWYNKDGSLKSTPAAYQTTSITTSNADGHSFGLMIRNKNNTNQTLTTAFASNVVIN